MARKTPAKAPRKSVNKRSVLNSAQSEALAALDYLRANSSWVCAAPDEMDDRDRLLPDRSKHHHQAPGRGRAGTSAPLNQ
jgi:hypothetical protein